MKVVYSEEHAQHAPETFIRSGVVSPNPEKPERARRFITAVRAAGFPVLEPEQFGNGPLGAVHSVDYLEFLQTGHGRWRELPGASQEIIPNAHPGRHMHTRPEHVVGQAGYHMADTACPIGAGTWAAAKASADVALTTANLVLGGESAAYGLCRPPGHHAYADMAGGFCFLNNVAIAAEHCRAVGRRVAILDIDVHHGNGTQGIFYERSDVFFASIHGDPSNFYPWFAGYASERGRGPGLGYNLNLPLAPGSGDAPFLAAIETALATIQRFGAEILLVSLGLDAQEHDPLGILAVTTDGFRRAGETIAGQGLPSVIVQEGGYLCPELADNLVAFLQGFETGRG